MSDDKTPVDEKYKKAVESQKSGVKTKGTYRYTFKAKRIEDGIEVIFNSTGEDVMDATTNAIASCTKNNWEYSGRVVENKSAYDRVRKEGNK